MEALDVGEWTVVRVRRRRVEEGLEAALNRQAKVLDGEAEARLMAIACGDPEGYARWSLRLLAGLVGGVRDRG